MRPRGVMRWREEAAFIIRIADDEAKAAPTAPDDAAACDGMRKTRDDVLHAAVELQRRAFIEEVRLMRHDGGLSAQPEGPEHADADLHLENEIALPRGAPEIGAGGLADDLEFIRVRLRGGGGGEQHDLMPEPRPRGAEQARDDGHAAGERKVQARGDGDAHAERRKSASFEGGEVGATREGREEAFQR